MADNMEREESNMLMEMHMKEAGLKVKGMAKVP